MEDSDHPSKTSCLRINISVSSDSCCSHFVLTVFQEPAVSEAIEGELSILAGFLFCVCVFLRDEALMIFAL